MLPIVVVSLHNPRLIFLHLRHLEILGLTARHRGNMIFCDLLSSHRCSSPYVFSLLRILCWGFTQRSRSAGFDVDYSATVVEMAHCIYDFTFNIWPPWFALDGELPCFLRGLDFARSA